MPLRGPHGVNEIVKEIKSGLGFGVWDLGYWVGFRFRIVQWIKSGFRVFGVGLDRAEGSSVSRF